MEEDIKNRRDIAKKKKKLSILDIITIVTVVVLLGIYAPRALTLYQQRKAYLAESKKEKVIEYPLEVEISEDDAKFFVSFFKDYAVGIRADIDFLDNITENEMVDFCRAILSEKYSSSGVISKSAMNSSLKKYFDVTDLNYAKLGYKELSVYDDYEAQKVFNATKLMKLEKDSELYLVYTDCIDKKNVEEGTYKKENIEDIYIFTFEKKAEQNAESQEIRYVLKKVEKEVIDSQEDNVVNNENVKNTNK